MAGGLVGYTIRRLLWAIPVLVVLSMLVFWVLRLAPGDPVDVILGERYDEQRAANLRAKYGYDEPIYVQYYKYMKNLAQGDMGVSTRHTDFTVSEVIWPKIRVSTQLGIMAMVVAFGIGIPIGIYAALARGTFLDPLVISFWLLIDAIPVFVIIPMLIWLFALKLDLVGLGWEGVWEPFPPIPHPNVILPVLILSLPGVAGIARFTRASVISVMHEDYVRTARAKGLKESTVVFTHIARNALLPLITVIGLTLPAVVTGALFVEEFFGIPGIGRESYAAVTGPDFDVILGLILFGSFLFVMANVLIDITYAVVDPRIRVGSARGG